MRRIETKKQIEKREKKRQIILSLVLVLLLVMSTAGWAINSFSTPTENSVEYNNLKFVSQNNVWLTTYIGKTFGFVYLPTELEDVSINISTNLNNYIDKPIYYVGQDQGMYEIANNLAGTVLRFQEACIEDCELDLPVKNCSLDSIIIFEEGDNNRVYEEEKCIHIVGDSVKGADKFLYEILDI